MLLERCDIARHATPSFMRWRAAHGPFHKASATKKNDWREGVSFSTSATDLIQVSHRNFQKSGLKGG